MAIAEPTTLATDVLVAIVAVVWGRRLARHAAAGDGRRTVGWWAVGFAVVAFAALVGGTYHGFAPALGETAARALWKLTVLAAGGVGFAVLAAAVTACVSGRARRWLVALAAVKLAVYLGWMATHDDFRWVIADYGGSLLVVLALHADAWRRRRDPASPWLAAAIAVSFLGAGVQASGFALHRHFDHNDLYHVVQVAGLWLFHRGALLARDAGSGPAGGSTLVGPRLSRSVRV